MCFVFIFVRSLPLGRNNLSNLYVSFAILHVADDSAVYLYGRYIYIYIYYVVSGSCIMMTHVFYVCCL